MITVYSIVGAAIAVALEYTYRTMPAPWTSAPHFAAFAVLQVLIGVCIYKIVTTPGTSLIASFIVWAAATILMRVFVSLILKDAITPGTWAALSLLVTARIVQHFWR